MVIFIQSIICSWYVGIMGLLPFGIYCFLWIFWRILPSLERVTDCVARLSKWILSRWPNLIWRKRNDSIEKWQNSFLGWCNIVMESFKIFKENKQHLRVLMFITVDIWLYEKNYSIINLNKNLFSCWGNVTPNPINTLHRALFKWHMNFMIIPSCPTKFYSFQF